MTETPKAPPQFDKAEALSASLGEILMDGPLYRKFVYVGRECHFISNGVERPRFGRLPKALKMFCDRVHCNAPTLWQVESPDVYFGRELITQRSYQCRNCGEGKQHYQFIWQEQSDINLFIKTGQWPPLTIQPSVAMAKALGPHDAELYKKGLIEFNFGHGIGAVAYLRRVLENKINSLLDLMVEAAQTAQVDPSLVAEVEEAKSDRQVARRIEVASKILPPHLRPGGNNPLDKLYQPLSAGLHGETDDVCLTIFSEARFVFEYLLKNLTENNEEARRYVREMSAPDKSDR